MSDFEQRRVRRDIDQQEQRVGQLMSNPEQTATSYLEALAILNLAAARLEELGDEEILPLVRECIERMEESE